MRRSAILAALSVRERLGGCRLQATLRSVNVFTVLSIAALLVVWPWTAVADLFELTVTSEGQTTTAQFRDVEDFITQLDNNGLNELIPAYTPTSAANAVLNIRGLTAFASYAANSTQIRFQVPCSGTDLEFQGATRDDSQDLLLDFLKGRGANSVSSIARCLVSDSPVDPVAGNPNSLMAKMATSDYHVGITTDSGQENLFQLALEGGTSSSDGFTTNQVSLPVNYVFTIPQANKPPLAVIFDLPIRYLDLEGASVFDGSFGLGFRVPIFNRWSLTPQARFGATGSVNAGALQGAYSGSLTSKVDFYFHDLRFSLNNMVGFYKTTGISAGDFDVSYDVQNTIFRNGIALEGSLDMKLFDDPTSWEFQFVDTRITGDKWFYDWYDEVTVTVGTRRRAARMKWQDLRFGVSYTFTEDFNRVLGALNYRF